MIISGEKHGYWWIQDSGLRLNHIIREFSHLLRNRTVAITSFDSGALKPNGDELNRGWYSKGGVFYARNVEFPSNLPYDTHDEWYIFEEPTEFDLVERFVNFGTFMLRDPIYQLEEADPSWDRVAIKYQIEVQRELQNKFWNFVSQIRPRAFVMDGERFVFGSREKSDFDKVMEIRAEQVAAGNVR